jgi:hypothetical protein
MKYVALLLTLVPALSYAADASTTTKPKPKPKPKTTTTTAKPSVVRRPVATTPPPKRRAPLGVDRSDTSWRFDLGYGFTKEDLEYSASASADTPTLAGYGSASNSRSVSDSASSIRLDFGPMYGVHPSSRGEDNGLVWGVDLAIASYKKVSFTLPATDADTTGTSANGTTFQSDSTLQTFAVGAPVGWAWDIDPQWSVETCGFLHLGILHAKYTSGENVVYGKSAPLGLFQNDLYNLYYDLGAKANLAYRFTNGVEAIATVGYVFGQSFKGTIKDAVTFYQGAANAQTGSYKEELTYKVSGPYVTIGAGYSF